MRSSFGIAVGACTLVMLSPTSAATPGALALQPTLAVVVVGAGGVTSKPAGISCPGRCSATFAAGTVVALTAKPRAGTRFARWGGACSGAGTCRVKVKALAAVAVQFEAGKAPPPPLRLAAEPGSYSGQNGQNGNGFNLYVAAGGRTVLNVTDPLTGLTCTPSGGTSDHLRILKTTIRGDGSFTTRGSQKGLYRGLAATFTYTVAGRFQKAGAGKAAPAAGTWREDIVTGDPSIRCTSNAQSWTAARDPGPRLQKQLVLPGDYTGQNGQNGNGFTLSVSADRRSVLNLSDPLTGLACSGTTGGTSDHLRFLKIPIRADGSFAAKIRQEGLLSGTKATFTYTVAGYFEGPTPLGAATVAGVWREDIELSGGTTRCTSNDQSWTATRSQ